MALPTSPPRRPRGQYAKTAARRAEIVSAGLEVFSASGYHAASLREIAEKVGLSQAGVLHHFANKWELLSAVLTLRDDHSITRVPSGEAVPGLETVRALVELVAYNSSSWSPTTRRSRASSSCSACSRPRRRTPTTRRTSTSRTATATSSTCSPTPSATCSPAASSCPASTRAAPPSGPSPPWTACRCSGCCSATRSTCRPSSAAPSRP
ncbi:TetR/AcrR family transcriptional regulator [Rathayibacter oskolensis]|nr:TetR/AcrR family transcriptional regulator [Rathayibacter oskolensis]WKK70569.1 TetR/AcrR family transcriptional regulator [Rathayibacter oskolensis]